MAPPAAYILRAPQPGDFAGVAAVLAADDLDDAGEVVLDEGFLRKQWERPGFALATDAWVAVGPDEKVVAYGQVTRDGPDAVDSWGIVHPAHRGLGLGAALLDLLERRAPALAPIVARPSFRNTINAGTKPRRHCSSPAATTSSGTSGHAHRRPRAFDPGEPPAGISITVLSSPNELPAVHAVVDEAFADHWGHQPEPFEDWADHRTSGASYDPQLWRLAWDGERLVGGLTATALEDRGWVDLLGVLRSARGRGIGAALLRQAFAAFADAASARSTWPSTRRTPREPRRCTNARGCAWSSAGICGRRPVR